MEKKGSRLVQPASKGLASDSKKSQDVASGKLWPRSGRRRESAGGSLSAKSESSRKPPPQRSKTYDIKRPRPRGAFNPGPAVGRTETTRLDEEFEAELGSVFLPGSKKQSLNHLLNFVYATPSREGRYQCAERGNKTSNRYITKKHKYNKEHFLQANCQFVVNTSGDYKQYMNNPDALVDWSLIEQVNVQVSDYPSCPICLYPPVAAKMTRCGHIYCWSCILHYLSLSDKTWRKCPICFESIHKQDLKSVVSKHYKTFNVDNVITFKLMKRLKGSLVTYPASAAVKDEEIIKFSDSEIDVYSKLLIANQAEILSIIDRENDELNVQLVENGDCPENCFIEEALTCLNQRRDTILKNCKTSNENEKVTLEENLDNLQINDNNDETFDNNNIKAENLDISTNQQSKFHYFYQASDGQHIYLHAINARMLEHTYGSLENSPETLSGKILEKEGGSMTEELRKRLRYLQHLPVTCQFEVAEIQLKQPIVSKETLEHFNEQIEVRRKRRQRRAREEKRREKKIADEENRLMGKYPIPNLHIESEAQFPCFDGRIRTESECTQPSEGSSCEITITPPNSLTVENEHAGPSFAKMLASTKKAETNKWPSLKATTAPTKLINVTGQKINSSCFNVIRNRSDSEPETEDFEPIPPSTSLGDAIVQALQKAEENDVFTESGSQPVGKKKKIKNRQKVLFTTTLAYTGK
ncbi:RING finger protein 10 [Tribolium madens]|uniref:RING finger protein 10 n=1 Tax=Tribolium madens TaxID=41895 RepID=UPI001CF7257D|nr:RING finger protein 10 [Tribolium madens]